MRMTHRTAGIIAKRLGDREINLSILRAKGYRMGVRYYVNKGCLVPLSESVEKPADVEEPEPEQPVEVIESEAAAEAGEPVRVHEWAKLWDVSNKDILKAADDLGIEAGNHMSKLSREDAALIQEELNN